MENNKVKVCTKEKYKNYHFYSDTSFANVGEKKFPGRTERYRWRNGSINFGSSIRNLLRSASFHSKDTNNFKKLKIYSQPEFWDVFWFFLMWYGKERKKFWWRWRKINKEKLEVKNSSCERDKQYSLINLIPTFVLFFLYLLPFYMPLILQFYVLLAFFLITNIHLF